MPKQVPQKIREERNQRLLETVNDIGKRKYAAFIGRQMQILVEGPSRKNPARMTGRTRCDRIVIRRRRTASGPAHGRENHPDRPVHALRRPGYCEFVTHAVIASQPFWPQMKTDGHRFKRATVPVPARGAKQHQRHFAGLLVKLRFQLQPERAAFDIPRSRERERMSEGQVRVGGKNLNRRNGLSSGVVSG